MVRSNNRTPIPSKETSPPNKEHKPEKGPPQQKKPPPNQSKGPEQSKSCLKQTLNPKQEQVQIMNQNTLANTEQNDDSDHEQIKPSTTQINQIEASNTIISELAKTQMPQGQFMDLGLEFTEPEVKKQVLFAQEEQMTEKVREYVRNLMVSRKITEFSQDISHNLSLENLSAVRLNVLKSILRCSNFFILDVDTSQYVDKIQLKYPAVQKIFFKIIPFKFQTYKPKKDKNLKNQLKAGKQKQSKEESQDSVYKASKLLQEGAQNLPQPVVVSLAELIHFKKIKNQTEFINTFLSDIMTSSTAAYYYYKNPKAHDYRIRTFFIELEKQILANDVRDSDILMAEKYFSKKKLYNALNQVNELLLQSNNFIDFVKSKKLFEISISEITTMLKDVTNIDSQNIIRKNEESLDTLAFPLFRLPNKQWNQFFGGSDIYNKLIIHMKQRRKNVRRYYMFIKNKKNKDQKAENPYAQKKKFLDVDGAQSDDSFEAFEHKFKEDLGDQHHQFSQYSNLSSVNDSEVQQFFEMKNDSEKLLQENISRNNAEIEQIIFNTNHSILDQGKINSHIELHIKKIFEDKKVPHFFSYSPSKFQGQNIQEDVINFKRAMLMKTHSVFPLKAYVERHVPQVIGTKYEVAQPDEFTYFQKAHTKYGGSVGGSALQSIGAMYNHLADFVVFQDRAFLLQTLCLMLKKNYIQVEDMISKSIDLSPFLTFDNNWNFYQFENFAVVQEVDVKPLQYQPHILARIAHLQEVQQFCQEAKNKEKKDVGIPGPWVITVDYKARGQLKTHFIVVKADIVINNDIQVPVFYCNHPSIVTLNQNKSQISQAGIQLEISHYIIQGETKFEDKLQAQDENQAEEYSLSGLFINPLQSLFGYFAKHNQGQQPPENQDEQQQNKELKKVENKEGEQDDQSKVSLAQYQNIKIFQLKKSVDQTATNLIAIQQLFQYFQNVEQIHGQSSTHKKEIMEQSLLSFAYNCEYLYVKDLKPEVIKYMDSILMTENGQLENTTKKEATQVLMKIFKMGYTIDDFHEKGSEVLATRDILADLLDQLDLQAQGTHGFECSDPVKLIKAYVYCKQKLEDCIHFIKKNDSIIKQREYELDCFETLLGKDLFHNSKDSLHKSVYLHHNVYLFMILTIRWIVLKLSTGDLTAEQITYNGIKREFLRSQKHQDQALTVHLSIPQENNNTYMRHNYKLGYLYCLESTSLEIEKMRQLKMHPNILDKQEEIFKKNKTPVEQLQKTLAKVFGVYDQSEDDPKLNEKVINNIQEVSFINFEQNKTNRILQKYTNLDTSEEKFLSRDQARAKWLILQERWVQESDLQLHDNQYEIMFSQNESSIVQELLTKIQQMKMRERGDSGDEDSQESRQSRRINRSRSREDDSRNKKQRKRNKSPSYKKGRRRSDSREHSNHRR